MNKYIKEYIELRKEEIVEEERLKKFGLLEKLKLGKMEYSGDFPDDPKDSFPYYDISRNDCYRYNLGEVSEEDYAELLGLECTDVESAFRRLRDCKLFELQRWDSVPVFIPKGVTL